jgi:hypothetical protein
MLWYQAFDCRGDPEDLLAKIEDRIARCNLARWIPKLCLKVVARGRSGRGRTHQEELLLFLGLDSSGFGMIPEAVERELLSLPQLHHRSAPCRPEEVAPVYEEWKKRIEGRVVYRPPTEVSLFTPQDLPWQADEFDASAEEGAEEQILEETRRYDRLLQYLSACGEGSWDAFRRVCAALWTDGTACPPARVLRRLSVLGHVCVAPDRSRWRVLPPLLVQSPSLEEAPGDDEAVFLLCGQRDRHLMEALDAVGRVTEEPQAYGAGPAAVSVCLDDPAALTDLSGAACCSDYIACLRGLPSLDEWRTTLPIVPAFATYEYEFRRYDGERFRETTVAEGQEPPGFYELWSLPTSEHGTQRFERVLYRDARANCWRSGDWYGLRFLSHLDHGWNGPVRYQTEPEAALIVPDQARLPEIYERALVIGSGLLPAHRRSVGGDWVYRGVPHLVAQIVAEKLSLQLMEPARAVDTEV